MGTIEEKSDAADQQHVLPATIQALVDKYGLTPDLEGTDTMMGVQHMERMVLDMISRLPVDVRNRPVSVVANDLEWIREHYEQTEPPLDIQRRLGDPTTVTVETYLSTLPARYLAIKRDDFHELVQLNEEKAADESQYKHRMQLAALHQELDSLIGHLKTSKEKGADEVRQCLWSLRKVVTTHILRHSDIVPDTAFQLGKTPAYEYPQFGSGWQNSGDLHANAA